MHKANILFIMTDQQRWDALGCSGGWVQTPHLDWIARNGLRFTNCITSAPECVPTRVSLATGLYPHNTGVWTNMNYELPAAAPTWMQAVRAAGYRTSLFGKTHLHAHEGDLREREALMRAYGFDDLNEVGGPRASAKILSHMTATWKSKGLWQAYQNDYTERFRTKPHLIRPSALGLDDYYDVYVAQHARDYLRDYDRKQPWFCWVSFPGPHEPWDTPEPYASRYRPEDMPARIEPPAVRAGRPQGELDNLLARLSVRFEPGEVGRLRANYAGNVTLIDDQVGDILALLQARGQLDQTVVVFTSDHGEMNGDYGLLYKSNFLASAVRVPLMISTPDLRRGNRCGITVDDPVEWFDIGPTLVELAGGSLGQEQFGKSLCPVLQTPEARHRADALSEFAGEVMLQDRKWKVALNKQGQVYLLFDLQNDPSEVNNLAGLPAVRSVELDLRLRILERLVQSQLTSGALTAQPAQRTAATTRAAA
jgi:choline-sulfatase